MGNIVYLFFKINFHLIMFCFIFLIVYFYFAFYDNYCN